MRHYLTTDAQILNPSSHQKREDWLTQHRHRLKHTVGAAKTYLREFEAIDDTRLSAAKREQLQSVITYFRNHHHQMHYAEALAQQLPIGSGVTESGCKLMVKSRLCGPGMQWKEIGAAVVLSLRTLSYTPGRWQQFWSKINQYGFSLA